MKYGLGVGARQVLFEGQLSDAISVYLVLIFLPKGPNWFDAILANNVSTMNRMITNAGFIQSNKYNSYLIKTDVCKPWHRWR